MCGIETIYKAPHPKPLPRQAKKTLRQESIHEGSCKFDRAAPEVDHVDLNPRINAFPFWSLKIEVERHAVSITAGGCHSSSATAQTSGRNRRSELTWQY